MNEVKLSTKVNKNGKSTLAIQLDMAALGLPWAKSDTIRVMSYKKDGTLILKRVGTRIKKTVCHTLTTTGGTGKKLGLYVAHKAKRFRSEFVPVKGISAGVRFIDENKTMLQVFLPRDVFKGEARI